MRYVDAGYVIALVALALYSISLLARRRRLERAAARGVTAREPSAPGVARGGDTVRAGDASSRDPRR